MFESCLNKQRKLKSLFEKAKSQEKKYELIIELGKQLPKLDICYKTPLNLVAGCQSTTYIHAKLQNDLVFFSIESDALISNGLAACLLFVYNEEPVEAILKCAPDFLEDIGISSSLTPSRSNGLYSIHLRMKQEAFKLLLNAKN